MSPQAAGGSPYGPPEDLPHDTLQPNLIAASILTWAVAAVFVALRFYTRTRIINALNSSDWLSLGALVFSLGVSVGESQGAVNGAGRHAWDLDPANTKGFLLWGISMWYSLLFYALTLCFSKMSILMLYMNIFTFLRIRQAAQVVMVIVIIAGIYLVCTVFTACIPLQGYWDITITDKYCHPQTLWWGNAILLVVTDFLVFLVPLPTIWTLRLRLKQRCMLLGIYCLGLFVCIISVVRLVLIVYLDTHLQPDFFYSSTPLTYWTLVEVNGAIVCACLMTLKPLVARVFPRLFSSNLSDREPDSDRWVNPPTIGSIPWREPPRSSRLFEGRNHHVLEEVHEEGTDPFVSGLKMDEVVLEREHRSLNSMTVGTDRGTAVDDLERWRQSFPIPPWAAAGLESQTEILRK